MMKIILVTRKNWIGVSRLPAALHAAGFKVGALCPKGSYLSQSEYLDFCPAYDSGLSRRNVYRLLSEAVREWRPSFVMAGDEYGGWFLRYLCEGAEADVVDEDCVALVNASLGLYEQRIPLERKSMLGRIARSLEIDFPEEIVSPNAEQARDFAAQHGFPVVLKRDYTSAGLGVMVVRDAASLEDDFMAMSSKSAEVKDDFTIQRFIPGVPASVSYAAFHGKLLGAFAFAAESTHRDTGFTVTGHVLDSAPMIEATRRLVEYFGLSGLGGVDFMLEENGRAWLLEVNSRPTPTSHLGGLMGTDLCALLYAALTRREPPPPPPRRVQRFAVFPFAWRSDKGAVAEFDGFHDVPWNDPPLLAALVRDYASAFPSRTP